MTNHIHTTTTCLGGSRRWCTRWRASDYPEEKEGEPESGGGGIIVDGFLVFFIVYF